MSAGLLDLPPTPTTRPRPPAARAPSDPSRASSDANGERFSLPAERPKAQEARGSGATPKETETRSGTPPKDASPPPNAGSQPAKAKSDPPTDVQAADSSTDVNQKSAATTTGDGTPADAEAAKSDIATAPTAAVPSTDAAAAPPATRQPGFLAPMRALGIANGKAPTPTEPSAAAGETPADPASATAAVAAGTPTSPQAVSAELRTAGSAKAVSAEMQTAGSKADATDADATEEGKAEPDETGTAIPSALVPIVLPTPPEASPAPSSSPDMAGAKPGGVPTMTEHRPGSAPVADPFNLLALSGAVPPKDEKAASAVGGAAGSAEAHLAEAHLDVAQPEKPSFGEHLAKATAEAVQTAASNPAADAAPSIVPPHLGAPATTPGLHLGPTHAAAPTTPAPPVVSGVPISAVPVEIGMKSLQGVNRFDIRLDPDDLGQIDVRLDISETGSVRAHIVVERPEALAYLQRETSHLERALEQAGFKAEDGVSLSLRQQNQGETSNGRGGEGREARPDPTSSAAAEADAAAATQPVRRVAWTRASGIDRHI